MLFLRDSPSDLSMRQCTLEEPTEVTRESIKEKKVKDKVPPKEKEKKEKAATSATLSSLSYLELCKLRISSQWVSRPGRGAQRQKGKAGSVYGLTMFHL